MMRHARFLGLVFAGALLPAAELVLRDLEASLIMRPTDFEFTLSTPSYQTSGNDGWTSGTAGELGYRHSFSRTGDSLGVVAGLSGTTEAYLYDAGGHLVGLTLRPSLGLGWAVLDRWTLVGEAGYSYGFGQMELPDSNSAPAFAATGTMTGLDMRAMSWWSVSRRFQLGALIGWQRGTWKLSGDRSTDLTIEQSGMYIGLGMAWRFSTDPVALE